MPFSFERNLLNPQMLQAGAARYTDILLILGSPLPII